MVKIKKQITIITISRTKCPIILFNILMVYTKYSDSQCLFHKS